MKKILFIVISLIFTSLRITAATGWLNDYVKIDINGAGTTAPTGWYWIGGNPSYATQLDGANLGVITSLTITGCDMKYWGDGADRTGGSFFYKIMAADNTTQVVAPVETIWTQSYLGGNDFQGITSVSINLLTGLSWGTTYKLHIWAKSWGSSQGDSYLSNSNNNYIATFTTQPAPTAYNVTGTGSYCQGAVGLAVGVANSETGVTYTLSPGGATQAGTGSAISFGTRTFGTYTVSGTNTGGTTAMTGSAVITENALPAAPTGPGSISICAGAFVSVAVGNGETTDWYTAASGGTLLATGPANYIPAGIGTYYAEARNTTSGCVSATRTPVEVLNIKALPTAVISGNATICEGNATNLTINLTGVSPKNFTYYDGSTSIVVNSIYSSSAIISVSPVLTKTYTITSVSDANCLGTYSGSAAITVNTKVTPTFTVNPGASSCANTDVTYTTQSGQTNYVWTYPGSVLGIDYSVTSGGTGADNTVTLQWKTPGSKSAGINYTPATGCTSNTPTTATTTVGPLSPTFTSAPGASTCAGTDVTYTTQASQSNYIWTYPGSTPVTDYSVLSGGGTTDNSVTLQWLTVGDRTVVVNYTAGGCLLTGTPATTSVHVNVTPSAAGTLSGTAAVTQGQNGVAYSVAAIANATSYIWAYTSGTGATLYGTGNSITIDFSASATSGNLTVQGLNDCGTGTVSANYPITVSGPVGPLAYAVTGTGSYCSSGASNVAVGVANSETGVTYELWKDGIATGVTQTGTTGSPVSFGNQTAGTYTVKGTKDAQTTVMTGSAVITAIAPPTAFAGSSASAIMGVPHLLSGATATNYTSVKWLLVAGNGSFSNDAVLQPTFTGTISGQFVTLQLTAKNGVCADASSSVQLVVIPAGVYSKTWIGNNTSWTDNTNWSPAPVPAQTDDVLIPPTANNPIISSTAICKDLTIESGTVLTIASGGSLTVAGVLTNSAGAAGLVVQSGGSLIENTSGVAATIERTISTTGKWHYIAVPNNNTYSDKFTGDFLRTWSEPGAAWSYITATTTKLNPVQGYSLWVKASYGSSKAYSFAGALNTGSQQLTGLTYHSSGNPAGNDGANFLGNPYPSSLDWAGLQTTYGAVYYWNGTAYESYINGSGTGSQFVPPLQGFFIVANATMISTTGGTFSVSNSNRVHSSTAFYKSTPAIKANSLILATAGESYSDKVFVNFNPEATEGFDLQNDAFKLMANTAGVSELYTFTGDTKLSVDVRPETQVIQLGFTNTLSGEYQIGIDQIAGIPVATLEDTKTSTFHDLLTGPYKFSYTAGESDKRFILLFGTTGLNEASKDAASIYSYQKTVYIHMADQVKGDIYIYNIAGQQVASRLSAQGMNEIRLPNTGNYIVKIISKNSSVVRKVFIQK